MRRCEMTTRPEGECGGFIKAEPPISSDEINFEKIATQPVYVGSGIHQKIECIKIKLETPRGLFVMKLYERDMKTIDAAIPPPRTFQLDRSHIMDLNAPMPDMKIKKTLADLFNQRIVSFEGVKINDQ